MATINNVSVGSSTDMILFDRVPSILKIDDSGASTSRATLTITVSSLSSYVSNTTYSITVNGHTITSVNDYSKAVGAHFFITGEDTSAQRTRVAQSIARAFSQLGGISANYTSSISSSMNACVLTARNTGGAYNTVQSTDFTGIGFTATSGGGNSTLFNSDITVEVLDSGNIVSRMEKRIYGNDVRFNLSDVFRSLSSYGSSRNLSLRIYGFSESGSQTLSSQTVGGLHVLRGYEFGNGEDHIVPTSSPVILQNVSNGHSSSYYNSTVLYVGMTQIPLSLYSSSSQNVTLYITYANADGSTIASATQSASLSSGVNNLGITLNATNFSKASLILIRIGNGQTMCYRVTKPINAHREVHRIKFYNSYGGTSFFDFTGELTDRRKTDVKTYVRSPLYRYTDSMVQDTVPYAKTVEKSATLDTGLIEEDAIYTLYDMQASDCAWITENGRDIRIDVTGVDVTKVDAKTFTAQVEYTYSLSDNNQ